MDKISISGTCQQQNCQTVSSTWCSRENVESFLPSRNVSEVTEVLWQRVKKIQELSFPEWLFSLLCHLLGVSYKAVSLGVWNHHHLQNIWENTLLGGMWLH